jgi:hypothetical protein
MGLRRRPVLLLQIFLNPQGLKALFTRSCADPGGERYRRAGLIAATSYIPKALTMLIGFVSVPLLFVTSARSGMAYLCLNRYREFRG